MYIPSNDDMYEESFVKSGTLPRNSCRCQFLLTLRLGRSGHVTKEA